MSVVGWGGYIRFLLLLSFSLRDGIQDDLQLHRRSALSSHQPHDLPADPRAHHKAIVHIQGGDSVVRLRYSGLIGFYLGRLGSGRWLPCRLLLMLLLLFHRRRLCISFRGMPSCCSPMDPVWWLLLLGICGVWFGSSLVFFG